MSCGCTAMWRVIRIKLPPWHPDTCDQMKCPEVAEAGVYGISAIRSDQSGSLVEFSPNPCACKVRECFVNAFKDARYQESTECLYLRDPSDDAVLLAIIVSEPLIYIKCILAKSIFE